MDYADKKLGDRAKSVYHYFRGPLSGMNHKIPPTLSWGPIKKKTRYCQGWQGLELMACAATRLALDSFWAVLIFALESGLIK
jgi:hypothetical protein